METWKPVRGYEQIYEVSDMGHVRSVAHVVLRSNGAAFTVAARSRKVVMNNKRRAVVCLCFGNVREMRQVSHMVLDAFVGERPAGLWGCHRDDNPENNRIDNLYWGTPVDNSADCLANGTHPKASKTHCVRGHEFTPENTKVSVRSTGATKRECRACLLRHNEVRRKT